MNKQIHELSVVELIRGLEDGHFSSVEIVKHYLDRINRYNSELNAFLYVNEDAIKQAEKIDKEIANGNQKPLLGIPLAVKDNFLTMGMPTTAAHHPEGVLPQYEYRQKRFLPPAP